MNREKVQSAGPKNIVICSDGTGNTANKNRGTNVFKLYEAIDLIEPTQGSGLPKQIAIYDDGVGTETFKPLRLLGGAFGWGLSRNVKELYAGLVRSYRPNDKIFLFGFSRGGFTVRALGGFITWCGILREDQFDTDADLVAAVKEAYSVYRTKYMTGARQQLRQLRGEKTSMSRHDVTMARFHERYQFYDTKEIAFIGVWDTVDAVGLPFDQLADFINYFIYPFKFSEHTLHPDVQQARHALSIDDERDTFQPLMWTENTQEDHDRIKQVWFAGVHSNVGGGYPKQGMSLVSLRWMMAEAENAGLRFVSADRDYCRDHENVNDKLYNSRAGLAVYYRYKPRDISRLCREANTKAVVHETVIDRIVQRTEGYAPGNLPAGMTLVGTGTETMRRPDAAAVIDTEYGSSDTSLLDRARGLSWIRRRSHYIFLGLTLWALWVAAERALPADDTITRLSALFSLELPSVLVKALLEDRVFDGIIIGVAIFFLVSTWAEKSMRRRFSGFWHVVVPRFSGVESKTPQ